MSAETFEQKIEAKPLTESTWKPERGTIPARWEFPSGFPDFSKSSLKPPAQPEDFDPDEDYITQWNPTKSRKQYEE